MLPPFLWRIYFKTRSPVGKYCVLKRVQRGQSQIPACAYFVPKHKPDKARAGQNPHRSALPSPGQSYPEPFTLKRPRHLCHPFRVKWFNPNNDSRGTEKVFLFWPNKVPLQQEPRDPVNAFFWQPAAVRTVRCLLRPQAHGNSTSSY